MTVMIVTEGGAAGPVDVSQWKDVLDPFATGTMYKIGDTIRNGEEILVAVEPTLARNGRTSKPQKSPAPFLGHIREP
jgi:hypothetical protein